MRVILYVGFAALLCACGLSPEQKELITAGLQAQVETGTLTQSQFETLRDSLSAESVGPLMEQTITALVSVAMAMLGVRAWRGSTTNRKGVAPKEA